MSCENENVCTGEILYASSYGGTEDYVFVNSIAASAVWLDAVKEIKAVVCETNRTFWIDFDLNSAMVFNDVGETGGIDPYLLFARRYCYRKFCETYCGYFGVTEIFGYLYRIFSNRHTDPPDDYDFAYADFVDSLLEDVRFIVCLRRGIGLELEGGGGGSNEIRDNTIVPARADSIDVPIRGMEGERVEADSLFSINDDYIEDDLLGLGPDKTLPVNPYDPETPTLDERSVASDETHSSEGSSLFGRLTPPHSTKTGAFSVSQNVRPPTLIKSYADGCVSSPMAADIAPDNSLQEAADTGTAPEMASVESENDTCFAHMPLTIMYDPSTGDERVITYEQTGGEKRNCSEGRQNVFVLDGLFDESVATLCSGENTIEITYSVRSLGNILLFNMIDISNSELKKTGNRGLVKLTMDDFVRAIRSFDSNARVLNTKQFDLYSFEVDLTSLHPKSLLKNKRKLYLRFVKNGSETS